MVAQPSLDRTVPLRFSARAHLEHAAGRCPGRRLREVVGAAVFLLALVPPSRAADPNSPEIREAIDHGVGYLRDHVNDTPSFEAGLVAYAMIRGGEPVDSPAIKSLARRVLDDKFSGGEYGKGSLHQYYEAGTDLMMFEAISPRRYQRELDIIAAYTIEHQWPDGAWYYPGSDEHGGDTSHTQYAVLGLWSAARAGIKIPRNVWSRIAEWHLNTQLSDGGFAYHPGDIKSATHSMTVNGVASLCICRLMLYPNREFASPFAEAKPEADSDPAGEKGTKGAADRDDAKASDAKPVPGVLQPIELGGARSDPARRSRITSSGSKKAVPLARINEGIAKGANWVRINNDRESGSHTLYFLYGLERMCALASITDFDGKDWYSERALDLIKKQGADGHFSAQFGTRVETSFAILFLSRATTKSLGGRVEARFGGGLMIGGRGLPANLGAVQTTGEGIQVRKLDAPVDKLLSELENPKSLQVEAVQQAIVDTVQLGDREKLVGQTDRLKKLARDPRAEVRRTAVWALGRCATVHDALVLVKALDDPDINVVAEANNALCWLSRRPNGFGRPADPIAELPENASDRQRADALKTWRTQVRKDWREWYDKVRPYSERDLPIDLP
jgi:hypothetical protein